MDDKIKSATALSTAAEKIVADQNNEDAPDPRKHYDTPEMLASDETMPHEERLALLKEWQLEIENRLKAEEEGMSATDPISAKREAALAHEAREIVTAIAQLSLPA
jgi:hypothetical protein